MTDNRLPFEERVTAWAEAQRLTASEIDALRMGIYGMGLSGDSSSHGDDYLVKPWWWSLTNLHQWIQPTRTVAASDFLPNGRFGVAVWNFGKYSRDRVV